MKTQNTSKEEFESWLDEQARIRRETYRDPTEAEIVEIFSDVASETIQQCLEYWHERRDEILTVITAKLRFFKEKTTDEFEYYFWRCCIVKLWEGKELKEADDHIDRLTRMLWMAKPKGAKIKKYKNFQLKKEFALKRPILDIVTPYISNLRKSGGARYKALCPFHQERTPSFTIYTDDSNHFYCFGCCKGGDTITFIRLIHNSSFKEAVDLLNS